MPALRKSPAMCDPGGPRLPGGWEGARETCLRVSPISLSVYGTEGPRDGEVALVRNEGELRGCHHLPV